MQNQVYTRYLYRILMEYGSVFIPEVGLFKLNLQSATFQQYMTVLCPPNTSISFDTNGSSSFSFADRLFDIGMEKTLALHTQSALVSDYKLAVNTGKPFILTDFGHIDNGNFTPQNTASFNVYHGLQEIKVTPLPSEIRHDENFLSSIQKKGNVENPSLLNKYWLPILALFIVASSIIFWFMRYESGISTSKMSNNQPNQEISQIETMPVKDTISDYEDIVDIPFEAPQAISLQQEPQNKQVITTEPEKPKTKVTSKKETVNTQLKDYECVIIVGAFKNHNNAAKLKSFIQKKGYQTYEANNGNLKRVGIKFDCSKTDAEKFKEEIRSNINKDAWLLEE